MKLPENQLTLLNALSKENPNIAVVLSCGCTVEMDWDHQAKALLHGYLGGQAGATALARLLMGEANPCGKLSETVPLRYGDIPSAPYYPGMEATSEYREAIYVGYRYFDTAKKAVKYPFGHGLSYTQFEYRNLAVEPNRITFQLRNTGKVHGEEVAQLYIHAATDGIFRPAQELKGFVKVSLAPGEEQEVAIPLTDRSFAVWSILAKDWVVEPGSYELRIGASSRDIRLTKVIQKEGSPVRNPYEGTAFEVYRKAQVHNVPDESFSALLGHPIPNGKWDRTLPLGFNDTIGQAAYLRGGLGKGIYLLVSAVHKGLTVIGKRDSANGLLFFLNMPWRNLGRMSGRLTDEQVHALLAIVNREKGSVRKFLKMMR